MIGIFDSGIGGLSVLRAVRAQFPHADRLYFGDNAHIPYGPRAAGRAPRPAGRERAGQPRATLQS